MKRLAFALTILAASLAAAGAENRSPGPVAVAASLQPKEIHEECARMEAGQSRRWHWKSDVPLDFNIHYHRGNDVFFPVKVNGMRGDGGTFTAKSGEDYCWMWTANDKPAKIEGRIDR